MSTPDEKKLFSGVLRLHVGVMALACGLICGLVIFIATNWLVIKGGHPVGPHLQLLSQYFPGYRVTFWGSLIGFGYGLVVGALSGAMVSWIYNKLVMFRN
jgi:hypothetical protein